LPHESDAFSKRWAVQFGAMQLLFCGSGWLPIVDAIRERLPAGSSIEIWDRAVPLVERVRDIDVLLPSNAPITADVIAAATRLRLIQQPAAGTERIDREAAQRRRIPVCNAPGTNHVAVAELALFLLLALARRINEARHALTAREVGVPIGCELAGKTLGIIGMGRTGSALAERARALGMHVIALGRDATSEARQAFFAASDAISIHCPLDATSRGLVGNAAFAAMRPGAFVINVSRGGVIDRDALSYALASDTLGGVGLDVHWEEPPDPDDALYRDPRVVALPHVAGSTREAFARITDVVIGNLERLERGESLLHRVC
jgi:phosphoglycerate dehydrogenase-like enzyme